MGVLYEYPAEEVVLKLRERKQQEEPAENYVVRSFRICTLQ